MHFPYKSNCMNQGICNLNGHLERLPRFPREILPYILRYPQVQSLFLSAGPCRSHSLNYYISYGMLIESILKGINKARSMVSIRQGIHQPSRYDNE